jgi:multidrug efflux system membrane fusion protein
VSFSVPQQQLPAITRHMAQGALKVEAFIPEDPQGPEAGSLSFLDNKVSSQSGTILLKANFENNARRLWPGQFVTAVLTLTARADAVVIPSQAVQVGQDGEFVYVIKADMTVESRPVSVGMAVGNDVVIDRGVSAGEKVVTEGQLRLVPGARVQVEGT